MEQHQIVTIGKNYAKRLSNQLMQVENIGSLIDGLCRQMKNADCKARSTLEVSSFYIEWNEMFKQHIQQLCNSPKIDTVTTIFDHFEDIKNYIDTYEQTVVEFQQRERFHILKTDSWKIKYGKWIKYAIFHSSKLPQKATNLFRKVFRKDLKPLNFWKHKIYSQRIARYVFLNVFISRLFLLFKDVLKFRGILYFELLKTDKQLEQFFLSDSENSTEEILNQLNRLNQSIQQKKDEITAQIEHICEKLPPKYNDIYSKAGTFEYPSYKLKQTKLEKQYLKTINNYEKLWQNWHNTLFCLSENWRLQHETRDVLLDLFLQHHKSLLNFRKKIQNNILPAFNEITLEIENVFESLNNKIAENNIVEVLKQKSEYLDRELLQKKIPKFIELVIENDITAIYDSINNIINNKIEELPQTKQMLRNADYLHPVKTSEIKEVAVKKLILEHDRQMINRTLLVEKNACMQNIDKITSATSEVGQIIEFAIIYFASKTDFDDPETELNEIRGGISRALAKAKTNHDYIQLFSSSTLSVLKDKILQFKIQIKQSIEVEQIFDVERKNVRKLRIEKNKERLKSVLRKIAVFGVSTMQFGQNAVRYTKKQYEGITTLLGIDKQKVSLSSEIANYLSETEEAINRLPLIYQKLFRVSPLDDDVFYIKRSEVQRSLEKAFRNWQKNKFAPTCLIGEKGSGSTTSVNFFLKSIGGKYIVKRGNLKYNINDEESFIAFCKKLFGFNSFDNIDSLIAKINQEKAKYVVVIENIQNLFLRKVNGFNNLQRLFMLMSETNFNVFWLTTSLIYTWSYLNHALKIEEYFAHQIRLDMMSRNDIVEIILKRHKPSGFNLVFLPPPAIAQKRKYRKLPDSQRQEFLRNNFFDYINEFIQSNITLALMFWMRSVKRVSNDKLYISYRDIDYSFLNSLDLRKVITLHTLLLHDGLTVNEHADIFAWEIVQSKSHLKMLYDDGITILDDDIYIINPLLYRQFVNLLKSQNFIY